MASRDRGRGCACARDAGPLGARGARCGGARDRGCGYAACCCRYGGARDRGCGYAACCRRIRDFDFGFGYAVFAAASRRDFDSSKV